MTEQNGGGPRGGGRSSGRAGRGGAGDPAKRRILDTGWDDFEPQEPAAAPAPAGVSAGSESGRKYKSARAGGFRSVLRFSIFTLIVGGLVLGGMYFLARPAIVHAVVDWGAENPTALSLPFVADIVRADLGASLTDPIDPTDKSQIAFEIKYGDTTAQIAADLLSAGLVTSTRAFVFEAIETDATSYFIAGRHVVSRSMTIDQIIKSLTSPAVAPPSIKILFREGLRIEQIVAKLEVVEAKPDDPSAPLKVDIKQYYDLATNPPADLLAEYSWLKIPAGASLEGFLFPATYDLAPTTTARQLIEQQLDAFRSTAPPELFLLTPDKLYEAVQVASLVEPEVKLDTDRALVAGVYYNRLDKKRWPTGLMNSNPSVNYATDSVWLINHPMADWVNYSFGSETGGTVPFAQIVFPDKIAPYNTYHHGGLPPTPIGSPGAASLAAAVAPDTKDGYFYFLAKNDGTGALAFAKTNAEQIANEKKYGYLP
jgi:UPF0755 protein